MNLSYNSIVIIIKNNISAQVMNEVDIKTSIRMYYRPRYDKDNSAMKKDIRYINEKIACILVCTFDQRHRQNT